MVHGMNNYIKVTFILLMLMIDLASHPLCCCLYQTVHSPVELCFLMVVDVLSYLLNADVFMSLL